MSKKIKHQKFAKDYEEKIAPLRARYYQNIIKSQSPIWSRNTTFLLKLIPPLLTITVLIINNFSLKGYLLSSLTCLLLNYLLKIITKITGLDNISEYEEEIHKLGYINIENYEEKLKKYLTGPKGLYTIELKELQEKYNLNENTQTIEGTRGEKYYIWLSNNQEKINLLKNVTTEKPQIKTFSISHIRYFREDYQNKQIILKTETADIYFKDTAKIVLKKLIKEKEYVNQTKFEPAENIHDFEIFIHKYKEKIDSRRNNQIEERNVQIFYLLISITILAIAYVYLTNLKKYQDVVRIVSLIALLLENKSIRSLNQIKIPKYKSEIDYIDELNVDEQCRSKFQELKYALNIKDSYDTIYNLEGMPFLTWYANGYFHLFLNKVYFNIIYMVINPHDILYFQERGNECELKTTDHVYVFQSRAQEVFRKILPSKDLKWLKEIQKNSKER